MGCLCRVGSSESWSERFVAMLRLLLLVWTSYAMRTERLGETGFHIQRVALNETGRGHLN